jgi:hypothetical protein
MYTQWIRSIAGLPLEGQPVEFVLDGREVAIEGTYIERAFRSRWSDYTIERVRSWRPAGFDSSNAISAGDMSS